jgi:DUF1680 family protein
MASGAPAASAAPPGRSLKPVPITAVKIEDKFWSPKLDVYRRNTIPHSWEYIDRNIKALKKLAGLSDEPTDTGLWTEANLHKFTETIAYSLALYPDKKLQKQSDEVISLLAAAQRPDGYIHAHVLLKDLTPWANLYHQHDGYVSGHLYEAAVAHYRVTKQRTLLDVACKSADQACRYFFDESNPGFPGHAEIELALVELYRATGQKRYLQLAQAFIERRGQNPGRDCPRFPCEYFQDDVPIQEQDEIKGHAVRAVFFATGVADVALETGDPNMRKAAGRLWDSTTKRKMYIIGSIGASRRHEAFGDDYALPNKGYCESCAACGLADFAHRMLMLQADGQCADVLERVLYNGILHGISLDGKSFYYRNPLHDKDHLRENDWCCCPPTLSRTLLKLGRYVYAKTKNTIYVNLYVAGNAIIHLPNNTVTLIQRTDYPWDGKVKILVYPQSNSYFSIAVRIPGWCQNPRLTVNGVEPEDCPWFMGYAYIHREWKTNDLIHTNTIELDFPMPIQRIEAHPNVKDNNGLVAIQRGPIVYGLEAFDNGGKLDIALPIDPQFESQRHPDFLGGVTVIKGKSEKGVPFLAIPFYALANRGKSSQVVWLPQLGKKEDLTGWEDKLYRPLDPSNLAN